MVTVIIFTLVPYISLFWDCHTGVSFSCFRPTKVVKVKEQPFGGCQFQQLENI